MEASLITNTTKKPDVNTGAERMLSQERTPASVGIRVQILGTHVSLVWQSVSVISVWRR